VESSTNVIRWLDKKEQFALQRAIEKDLQVSKLRYPKRWLTHRRDASLTVFLLNTGLRLNECTELTLADVTLSTRKGSVLVQNGKGSKQRVVPLNNEARKAIEEWLKVRRAGGEHLWTTVEAGEQTKLTGRTVQRMLARYAQEAGLENLTPHMLRHTFAKNLVMNDVGLEEVATLLGHANLNTTRTYITPSARDLEESVNKLDQY
jgi:integrase/recombinase XerC